jgi:hypothetical protein
VPAVIADDSVLLREGITRLLAEDESTSACLLPIVTRACAQPSSPQALAGRGAARGSQVVEERCATELLSGETRGLGCLLKDRVADLAEFIEALRRVISGGTVLDPEVVRQLLAHSRKTDPLGRLTRGSARCCRSWPRDDPTGPSPRRW